MKSTTSHRRTAAVPVEVVKAQRAERTTTARRAAAEQYVHKAQDMRTLSETLVTRSRQFDYANLAVELATAHTATLAAAPGLSGDNDFAVVDSVLDVNGDPFDIGYHYFPDADPGEQSHMVVLGEHATPIAVGQIPELIRLLLAAAAGACNHPVSPGDEATAQ